MPRQITIDQRFNGPPTSGNGGYSCGALAAFIDGPARIRLQVPPPLDTPLRVEHSDDGVAMYDGETLVGTGASVAMELDIPPAPSLAEAQEAKKLFPCYEEHTFGTCFVCGPHREAHDGLELFPGPVRGSDLVACPWQPGADTLDSDGFVRDEILWSALDCPGFFGAMGDTLKPAVLGQLDGEIRAPVKGDQTLVVYAWALGEEGRKLYAGTAIATAAGEVHACSRAIWITL